MNNTGVCAPGLLYSFTGHKLVLYEKLLAD